MKMSFRWYGESDPISLQYIRQIPNMRSIVSAVYDVKPGEVWPEESIEKMVKQCEENGLVFDVVESIPVHENIKLGSRPVSEPHLAAQGLKQREAEPPEGHGATRGQRRELNWGRVPESSSPQEHGLQGDVGPMTS